MSSASSDEKVETEVTLIADDPVESESVFSLGNPETGDRVFYRVVSLIFLAGFLFALQNELSPFLIGASLLVLLVMTQKGVPFEAGIGTLVGLLFGAWFISDVAGMLWPFVVSFVLAYLLAPLVGVVERWLSRTLAIALIVLLVLGTLSGIGVVVIPRIIDEVSQFVSQLPAYGAVIRGYYTAGVQFIRSYGYDISPGEIQQWFVQRLPEVGKLFADQTTAALRGVSSGLAALVNLLMIPFVTFYVLKDYDRIKQVLERTMPRRYVHVAVEMFAQVDNVLGQYVRGQILVCSFIALLTSVGLALSGIPYSLLLGISAGISNLIPFIGLAISLGVASLVALLGNDPLVSLVKVFVVFVVVQNIEGNFLSPRVVGQRVGLHPVWVMFALVVAAHFWGFVGMIVAIPVAAVVNILVKILIDRYYNSRYYGME